MSGKSCSMVSNSVMNGWLSIPLTGALHQAFSSVFRWPQTQFLFADAAQNFARFPGYVYSFSQLSLTTKSGVGSFP